MKCQVADSAHSDLRGEGGRSDIFLDAKSEFNSIRDGSIWEQIDKSKYPRAIKIVQRFFPNVDEVEDARTSLVVDITEADNRRARKRNHKECAMAVCAREKEKADGVIISIRTAYIIKGTKAVRYRLPESVSREIVSFDRTEGAVGFEPGRYVLGSPKKGERLGEGYSGRKHDGPKNKRGKPSFVHETENIRTSLRKVR